MKKIFSLMALSLLSFHTYADDLSPEQQASVKQLIQAFQKNDVDAITQRVVYPLQRDQPLPEINNAQEMKQRFNQVFDASLKQDIATSSIQDWSVMGSRGIMLGAGEVWLDGENGDAKNLKITAINHTSTAEEALRQQLLQKSKASLHPSLRQFAEPELIIKTKAYLIRIDKLNNGKYRYASWKNNHNQASKPDLVLNNGMVEADGSGGNHEFVFQSGSNTYKVYRNHIGYSDANAVLTVEQNGKEVLHQEATLVQ